MTFEGLIGKALRIAAMKVNPDATPEEQARIAQAAAETLAARWDEFVAEALDATNMNEELGQAYIKAEVVCAVCEASGISS